MVERFGAGLVRQWWDSVRDIQDGLIEWNFHLLWASQPVQKLGEGLSRTVSSAPQEDLHNLSSVQDALDRIAQGGFPEAVIRMLIFLAQSRREVRRSRLERSNKMLLTTEPFASMPPKQRTKMIHRESLIVGFEPERALAALPELIPLAPDRRRALELCLEIAGPVEEMSLDTIVMLNRLTLILEPLDQPAEAEPAALVQERKL
jgi:hypothetical protein